VLDQVAQHGRSDADKAAELAKFDRALLAYDGASAQVNHEMFDTFMKGHLSDKTEIFKWPAGTSMAYQWGDVARIHKDVKSLIAKVYDVPLEEELRLSLHRYVSPQILSFVKEVMPTVGLSLGSLKTHARLLLHIEDILSRVFTTEGITMG
jgi:hypothetical protein